jgi:DUF177 domain-containing protein
LGVIIRAADLDPEGLVLDLPLELDPLRSEADEAIRVDALVVSGRVMPVRGGLSFRGRLICKVEVPCARCLVPYAMDLDRPFDLRYTFAHPSGKELQIPDEDLDCAFLEEGGILDLRQVAAEQIYLELPMKPLCRPSCRGLCAHCGADLNKGACLCEDHSLIS